MKFQAIKGVRDILPPESALWNRVEQTAREVFGTFGFAEIRLPIFEQTELFARSVGQETDIVSKEMYTFEDHDHLDLARVRSSLLVWENWGAFPKDIRGSVDQVGAFLAGFKRLYEAGKVPRTSDNEWARQRLAELLNQIVPEVAKIEMADSFRGSTSDRVIQIQIVETGMKKFEA